MLGRVVVSHMCMHSCNQYNHLCINDDDALQCTCFF